MSSPPSEQTPFPKPLVDAWRAARPVAPELQRGYSRFLRRRSPRKSASTFGRWLLGGVLLGAGLAQAATSQPWRAWRSTEIERPAPPKHQEQPGKASTIAPQPSLPITASPELLSVPSAVAPLPPAARNAVASPALAPLASPSAASFHVQEQWRLAAEGLRTGNGAQAERALLDLERTARGGEREAAQLARAQLLARSGRTGQALRLASELERSASSSVVRDKARELTQSLSKNANAERSHDAATGINQP